MSIFDSIKNAIFRHAAPASRGSAASSTTATSKPGAAAPGAAAGASATSASRPGGSGAGGTARAAGSAPSKPSASASTPPQPGTSASQALIDIEPALDALAQKNSQKLNWRTSIVDLMKLLDLDSSLQHRKELAKELGYTGSTDDSAAMNIWLHKQVMAKLAANGGKVPASLL